jgi:hypothetical protein
LCANRRGDHLNKPAGHGEGSSAAPPVRDGGRLRALVGDAALPSATRPADVPRVDVGQVDVWHFDVRDVDNVWHVDVRDVKVDVAGHARDVQVIEGCVVDASRAELDMRWTRDDGGKNRRCGGGSSRERC